MNELLNEQTTFLDVDEKDKDGILKFISHKAKLLDITDDEDALYHDFLEREKNSLQDYKMDLQSHMQEQITLRK